MPVHRRRFVQGIGAGIAALAFAGVTTAADRARYLVTAGGQGVVDRLGDAGFEVERSLADGDVYVVWGPADATADIEEVGGVTGAAADHRLALESPVASVSADADGAEPPAFYEDFLWDKQVTSALEATAYATGEGASIAVIDTGVDYAHPELEVDEDGGRLFREGTVREGVGEVVVPDDYAAPTALETATYHVADEQQGHGTHVAGIAAAGDGDAVIGTAPDATVVSLRVFWWDLVPVPGDDDDPDLEPAIVTTTADVLSAIDHAAARGDDVANLSLGTAPIRPSERRDPEIRTMVQAYQRVVRSAVQRGTVVAGSAGNDATRLQQGGLFSLPNSVEGAISISATGPGDDLAFYSDYGTGEIDVGAPGGGYETLVKTYCGFAEWIEAGQPMPADDPREAGTETEVCLDEDGAPVLDPDDAAVCHPCTIPEWPYPFNLVFSTTSKRVEGASHGWKAGTSMSAPQVAGLVALVRELDPDASPNQVESAIEHGAQGDPGRSDPERGAGRIDALETVELVRDGPGGGSPGRGRGRGRGNRN